jgi:hypothetical protein
VQKNGGQFLPRRGTLCRWDSTLLSKVEARSLGKHTMPTGNRVLVTLLFAAIFCAGAPHALAQRGRGFGFGPNRAQLSTLREVQADLKMTDDQIAAARAITDAFNLAVGGLFGSAKGDVEVVRAGMPELHQRATDRVNEKLNPGQQKRLTEIFVQQNGVNSVFDAQVRASLKLTDEQMAKLHASRIINREAGAKATRETPHGEKREDRTVRFEKIWKESEDRILSVLTQKQVEQFKSMRGDELEVNVRPLFPPPPRTTSRQFGN